MEVLGHAQPPSIWSRSPQSDFTNYSTVLNKTKICLEKIQEARGDKNWGDYSFISVSLFKRKIY